MATRAAGGALGENNPFVRAKDRPLVTGRRGVPGIEQENTIEGLRRAVELGIPAVALDVMVTACGRVVCFHDDDTARLTGESGSIAARRFDEVSRLRLQRRVFMGYGAEGQCWINYPRARRIPLLAEVLDEFKGKLAINVEMRPSRPIWSQRQDGATVARVIRDAGAEDSVVVTSFDLFKLVALEHEHPGLRSGFAYNDGLFDDVINWMQWVPGLRAHLRLPEGARSSAALIGSLLEANAVGRWVGSSVCSAEHTLLHMTTVETLRERSIAAVGAYTLFPLDTRRSASAVAHAGELEGQSRGEIERLIALGVDWIETDDPERMLEHVGLPSTAV